MPRRTIFLVCAAVVVLLLVYPFNVTVAPEWNVKVVDERGRPVPGAHVLRFATQWTLHFQHNETVCTDYDGTAHFPRLAVRANIVTRFSKWVAQLGPHSSLGPDVKVGVERMGYGDLPGDNTTANWNGWTSRMNSQFTLHKLC